MCRGGLSWYVFLVFLGFLRVALFSLFVLGVCICTDVQDISPEPFEPRPLKLGNLCTPCDVVGMPMPDTENGYRIAVKYRNADGILVLHIVLGPHFRIGAEGFIGLACKFRKDFGAKSDVFVRVFDNEDAAKKYVDPSSQHKPRDWQRYAKSFKAFYTWEPTANQNIVAWNFDPLNPYSDGARRTVADLCPPR